MSDDGDATGGQLSESDSDRGSLHGGGGGGEEDGDGQAVQYVLKFEATLYKAREEEYVLDVQRLEGELFIFTDVCGRLLADLRF